MSNDALALVRRELREQLRHRVDARGLASAPRTERRLRVREEALAVLREHGALETARLARACEVAAEVLGFGPVDAASSPWLCIRDRSCHPSVNS